MAETSPTAPAVRYRIRFRGTIGAGWLAMYQDVHQATEGHGASIETTLTGTATDDAALIGLLNMIHDLGGALMLVEAQHAP